MLRIHSRVILALVALSFVTGAITAGVAIGAILEGFYFIAGAGVIGLPMLVIWAAGDYLKNRGPRES